MTVLVFTERKFYGRCENVVFLLIAGFSHNKMLPQ